MRLPSAGPGDGRRRPETVDVSAAQGVARRLGEAADRGLRAPSEAERGLLRRRFLALDGALEG